MSRRSDAGPEVYKVPESEAERRKNRPSLSTHPSIKNREPSRTRPHRTPWNLTGKVSKRQASD